MRVLNFILIVLILPLAVLAQDIEIFGYFEPQLMVAKIKDDFVQMSSNKLRVDLKYQPGEQFTFGANFDYITYHGKTKWDILEYLPENVVNEASQIDFLGYEINSPGGRRVCTGMELVVVERVVMIPVGNITTG